jgi:hypothetical protein
MSASHYEWCGADGWYPSVCPEYGGKARMARNVRILAAAAKDRVSA